MKATLSLTLFLALCSPWTFAAESGSIDKEKELIQQGVLGTVNVLRELDPRTFTNRVTVTSNVKGRNGTTPALTIDGSGEQFRPDVAPDAPMVLTYALPGLRTVASLVITYGESGSDAPTSVRLEGSADGGKTWFDVFNVKPRKSSMQKVFRPVQVNALRITQEGDGTDKCARRTREVFAYADSAANPPLFGGPDSGAFSFLRSLWYDGKIKLLKSKKSAVWTQMPYGLPEKVLFQSAVAGAHDGGFGDAVEKGKRLYLLLNVDEARRMDFGLIGIAEGDKGRCVFGFHPAEFYTANGALDPATLAGSAIADITAQGWVLQKKWDADPSLGKSFALAQPGKFNQILVVWDAFAAYENDRWGHLEMFGAE